MILYIYFLFSNRNVMQTFTQALVLKSGQRAVSFPTVHHVTNVSIQSAVIPLTSYNITSANGFFSVNGSKLTIPSMNYSEGDFLEMIDFELSQLGINFTRSHDGKLVFKSDDSFDFTFTSDDLGMFLGFPQGSYTSTFSSSESKYVLSSLSKIQIYNTKYIIVKIEELSDEIMLCAAIKADHIGKRLLRYNPKPAINQVHFNPLSLNKLTFKIEDEFGNSYNTNGLDSIFIMEVTVNVKPTHC